MGITLKEKFKGIVDDAITYNQQYDSFIQIFVQITDEFAIGFAEWLVKNYDGRKSVIRLLEIYKKEKGL